ncbi:hypothetical protein [Vibrio phage vB_VmeM-Yong XC32]|nr:hypothetical protein [Vibrio phage vB_VmeM-Yong XC31]QAX96557.1 hypothetical protein [Vibrio phage vB_VmeM-Yong XC32]QAX96875.1 hypothetical protein [Vibrio phage vB_VmeM-Yong MS31]QAX97180.1 hypothetical protein [Vibrio phage vB_VmeM-Yong MS32]
MSTLKDLFLKWAGIGSRETPEWVFPLFIAIGWHMASLKCKLFSGGAPGPDTEFERGTIRFMRDNNVRNLMEIWLPWRTFGKRKGIDGNHYKVLDKPDYDFARHILNDSGVCVNPWFVKMGQAIQKLFARNVYQILTGDWSKVDLVIYYAKENREKGTVGGENSYRSLPSAPFRHPDL